jgi:hypothetical protein
MREVSLGFARSDVMLHRPLSLTAWGKVAVKFNGFWRKLRT